MPQLILELSANVVEKDNMSSLFKDLHFLLEKMLPTDLDGCKSRSIECGTFCVGDGNPVNAFVHVTLKVMTGRNHDTLKKVGDSVLNQLRSYFSESLKKLNMQITLEIIELQKTYFKLTS